MFEFNQIFCLSLVLFIGFSSFQQYDYKLVHHRVETGSYNKSIVTNVWAGFYHYNRTTRAFNMTETVMTNFTNVKVHVQLYKFLSNEYRYFPVEFEFDLCRAMQQDSFDLRSMHACGNMADSCIYIKGHIYSICNFLPDSVKFPPHMPTGDYKVEFTFKTEGTPYLRFAWFGSVVEITKWN